MITKTQLQEFVVSTQPENWPTMDEFPEADTSDLMKVFLESKDQDDD